MWLFYHSNFERNYDLLKSKSPCILLNKNINFNKNETKSKWKITHTVLESTLSELHTFIYLSKNITSNTFLLIFKIVENLQCIRSLPILRWSQKFLQRDVLRTFQEEGLSNTGNFSDFNNEFKNTLNDHAPIETSKVRRNTKPLVNKILRREMMKRSNLKIMPNKSGEIEDKKTL